MNAKKESIEYGIVDDVLQLKYEQEIKQRERYHWCILWKMEKNHF
jgi:hypothetical protein